MLSTGVIRHLYLIQKRVFWTENAIDFWSKVISDFDTVAKSERKTLSIHIQRGVPPSLRGMVWQLLAKSKDPALEERYLHLINEESVYEKAITRDLPRTFPSNDYFQSKAGQEALFNVVKAYSLYDTDVGYCQGISFIAGPLLLNVSVSFTSLCVTHGKLIASV